MIVKRGNKGINVLNIQMRLQSLGYPLKRDGLFGSETERYVKEFQKSKGLNPDGIVGDQTFRALGLKPVIEVIETIKPESITPVETEIIKPVSYTKYYLIGLGGLVLLYLYLKGVS